MAAHRYWRINITAANGGIVQEIAEMEYRIVAGGADVTGSGTPGANNWLAGSAATHAFDNNASTRWIMNTGTNWVRYDFGAGNDKDVVEVAVIGSQSEPENAPKNFTIQWSDDNSAWTTWLTVTNMTSWYAGERKIFNSAGVVTDTTIPAATRYWRIVVEAIASGIAAVAELELRETAGGADATGGGTAITGTTVAAGKDPVNAFDNNPSTHWQHGGFADTTPFGWFAYDFGSGVTKTIVEVAIQATGTASAAPTAFRIQRSDDGLRWHVGDIVVSGLSAWSASQTRYFQSTGEVAGPSSSVYSVVFICT